MNKAEEVKYEIEKLLNNKEISNYEIEKCTGISRAKIGRIKRGINKLDNIAFNTALILYDYAIKVNK